MPTALRRFALVLTLFVLVPALSGVEGVDGAAYAKKTAEAPAPQKIVFSLKHGTDDLHAAFMAFKLGKALQSGGAEVTVFLNLEGARLADVSQPVAITWGPSDMKLKDVMKGFVAAGGTIVVCPHCAKAAGIGPDDLREGMHIGTPEELTSMFLEAAKVIDY